MSEPIEFDGNYGRTGKIEVKVERCCACKVHGPCLVADQSNGEYSPAIICSNCIAKMFGATQPQAPQDGFQLVPTKPTPKMIRAMSLSYFDDEGIKPGDIHYEIWVQTYKAALQAAPTKTPEVRHE